MSGPQRKRLVSIGTFGALLTLMVLTFDYAGSLDQLERWLYDIRLRNCQVFAKPPTDTLAHLDIDDGALSQVGAWPWPRSTIAGIVDELKGAGAKVIVFDVLFSEPRRPELVQDVVTARVEPVDHDDLLAKAIARAGNVLVPASLKLPPLPTPADEAVTAALLADLELSDAQLIERLVALKLGDAGVLEKVKARFVLIREEAMCARIQQELALGTPDNVDALKVRLLPRASREGTSAQARQLEQALGHVRAREAMGRFALPQSADVGSAGNLIAAQGGQLPIPRISERAAYGGFVDYLPDRDGLVRKIPLAVRHEGDVFPQISLVAACAVLGVDPKTMLIGDDAVVVPRPGLGNLVIPTRTQLDGEYEGTRGFLDIPLTDQPGQRGRGWEATPRRVSVMDVLSALDTDKDIAHKDLLAAELLARVLDASDPDAAAEIRKRPPPFEELSELATDPLSYFDRTLDALAKLDAPTPDDTAELEKFRELEVFAKSLKDYVSKDRRHLVAERDRHRKVLAGMVADRAVFIGSIATGAYDFVATSRDPRCPGVYLHGAAFNAIMTGESWRQAPRWTAFALTAAVGLLTTVFIAAFSPPKAAVAVSLLAAGYAALNGYLLFDRQNLIVGAAGPLVAAGVVWSGVTLIQFVREIGERNRLTGRFRSYVDPTLVSYVIENPDQARLEAQEKELTVAFCDLAGFTTLSERLRAESAKMLGRYMETMVPLIRARNGYVNKFLGDGIMFFFGAPLANDDHAACAVGAALDMQAALGPFNEDLASRGLPTLAMRTGVSTGLMVVGDAGPSFASDYTVLGDAVNLAARLESANKAMGTSNLITGRTVEMVGERFLIRPVANLLVVGKKNSVWVHEALAPMATATEEQKRFAAMTAAFVNTFNARDFEACLAACKAFEEEYGKSKLTDLYVAEASTCLRSRPGDDFCGIITLQAK